MERNSLVVSIEEATAVVKDGMTIAIGGFITANIPMALIREIIRRKIKGLTIVAIPTGLEIDLLIEAGCVETIIVPYVGAESISSISPIFRHAAEKGKIKILEVDSGMVLAGLRAGIAGLPFSPWRGGVGTSLPDLNPYLKTFRDPINNEELIAVPAIVPDIALLHAASADKYGNVHYIGTSFVDKVMAQAANICIVQVERIIPHEAILSYPDITTIPNLFINFVVKAPYGAHPYASEGFYKADVQHLNDYLRVANSKTKGDFDEYLNKYVIAPPSHEDYLDQIGIKRLLSLAE